MYRDSNIVGYLQRRQFFQPRTPSPSPQSRFHPRLTPHQSQLDLKIQTSPSLIQPQQFQNRGKLGQSKINLPKAAKENQNLRSIEKVKKSSNVDDVNRTEKTVVKSSNPKKEEQFSSSGKSRATSSFDSSRLEIKMCLEDFSRRVTSELRLLESSLSQLTNHLEQLFHQRLSSLKQQLSDSMEAVFAKAKTDLAQTLSCSTQKQLTKFQQTKVKLTQAENTLIRLKGDMQLSWKRVAAEVFGNSLDEKIQKTLGESEKVRKQLQAGKEGDREGWDLLKKGLQMLLLGHFAGSQNLGHPSQLSHPAT